jgi:hypothetical protein
MDGAAVLEAMKRLPIIRFDNMAAGAALTAFWMGYELGRRAE